MLRVPPLNGSVDELYELLLDLQSSSDRMLRREAPVALYQAYITPGFIDSIQFAHAEEGYTRRKLIGGHEKGLVIRSMEWAPGTRTWPHEHHNELCAELIVSGRLIITDVEAFRQDDGLYHIETFSRDGVCTREFGPGQTTCVCPETDMHIVYSPERSRSLHVYSVDPGYGVCYKPQSGKWRRETGILRED